MKGERKRPHMLATLAVRELCRKYRDGAKITALMAEYDISKKYVYDLLGRCGVPLRARRGERQSRKAVGRRRIRSAGPAKRRSHRRRIPRRVLGRSPSGRWRAGRPCGPARWEKTTEGG